MYNLHDYPTSPTTTFHLPSDQSIGTSFTFSLPIELSVFTKDKKHDITMSFGNDNVLVLLKDFS